MSQSWLTRRFIPSLCVFSKPLDWGVIKATNWKSTVWTCWYNHRSTTLWDSTDEYNILFMNVLKECLPGGTENSSYLSHKARMSVGTICEWCKRRYIPWQTLKWQWQKKTLYNVKYLQYSCAFGSAVNHRLASLVRSSGMVGRKEFLEGNVSWCIYMSEVCIAT